MPRHRAHAVEVNTAKRGEQYHAHKEWVDKLENRVEEARRRVQRRHIGKHQIKHRARDDGAGQGPILKKLYYRAKHELFSMYKKLFC